MHWAFKIAQDIIAKRPDLPVYTVACGMTPSGNVHIGNYREFITNYYVAKALHMLGKPVRMIFSWDDYDRFRKVPKGLGVDETFSQHLGKPVSAVPNPFDSDAKTYAGHFENIFQNMLTAFGNTEIPVEFIYQHKKYTNGDYNQQIIHAIKNRKKIYDIIDSFKTKGDTPEDGEDAKREDYYPVAVYCKTCGKDFTKALSFNEKTNILEYECKEDKSTHKVDVTTANNIKLVWKVDWPMRWKYENVVFEAAGIDHHSEKGSFAIGRRIIREIFNYPVPETCVYAWNGIKGVCKGNMSSSSGINITPQELLKVYEPEIIRWLFAKYHHTDSFDFGFDDIVARHYTEFDRNIAAYIEGKACEYEKAYMDLALFDKPIIKTPFATISTIAPVVAFDFKKSGLSADCRERFTKAQYWLENYMHDKIYKMLPKFNTKYYKTLSDSEKNILSLLSSALVSGVEKPFYSTMKANNANIKRYSAIMNNLLFGRDDGPRLDLYLGAAGKNAVLKLLNQ